MQKPRSAGQTSPSFIIAMILLLGAGAAYIARQFWFPNAIRRSEQIVRGFAADAGKAVGTYRRTVREVVARFNDGKIDGAAATAEIDEAGRKAKKHVVQLADGALDDLDALEKLPERTRRNREKRIQKKIDETKQRIVEIATEGKARLQGDKTQE